MKLKNDEKSEKELTCCFKIDVRSLTNFDLKVSKIYTLMGFFCPKYIMCHTRVWCKIWRKCYLWFGKWDEEIGKFPQEHTKFSKLGLSLDPFIQSRKCMSLKCKEELCIMTARNDAKFEIELTRYFKSLHEEFNKFWPKHSKNLKDLHFNGLILTKVYNVSAKKVQRSYFGCTQDWYKVWRKTVRCFQKLTWGIWQIFTRALESLQIGTLMAPFCLKLQMYELKIYTRNMCHTMKNDTKIEEELICQFKLDMRNLTNFDPSTRKSQKVALYWAFLEQSI